MLLYKKITDIHDEMYEKEKHILDAELDRVAKQLEIINKDIETLRFKNKHVERGLLKSKDSIEKKYRQLSKRQKNLTLQNKKTKYKRKAKILAERFPSGAFYIKEGHSLTDTVLYDDEILLYEVLIGSASSSEKNCLSKWCTKKGKELTNCSDIVLLYEYISQLVTEEILNEIDSDFIKKWLSLLSFSLDYPISKRIYTFVKKIHVLKDEGLCIRNQINFNDVVEESEFGIRYHDIQFGQVPSATPKLESPENYRKFKHEEQFFSGLYTFLAKYLFPEQNIKTTVIPLNIQCKPIYRIYTLKELNDEIYFAECNAYKNGIIRIRSTLKNVTNKQDKQRLEKELIGFIKGERLSRNKDSRIKEYERKYERLREFYPLGASFMDMKNLPNRNESDCNENERVLDFEQQAIYFVLIRYASIHNSIVNLWFNNRHKKYGIEAIIDLYDLIQKEIYKFLGVNRAGVFPYTDQWLQILDVHLDYSVARWIDDMRFNLEALRLNTFEQRFKAYSEIGDNYVSNDELFLDKLNQLCDIYLVAIKRACRKFLTRILLYGKRLYNEELKEYEKTKQKKEKNSCSFRYPEYVQALENVKNYINSKNDISCYVLRKFEISIKMANTYIDGLISYLDKTNF